MSMFGGENNKTTIIIVADKRHQKYASFLLQLFSRKDDADENTITGVKDDTVKAAIWTDRQYNDSKEKAVSTNKFIFIGDSKIIVDETANIPRTYKKYGMRCGWLGTRAILDLDQMYTGFIKPQNRNEFGKYVVEMHKAVGLTDDGRDSWKLNAGYAANPLTVKDVQYNCLVEVFYLYAAQKFVEE